MLLENFTTIFILDNYLKRKLEVVYLILKDSTQDGGTCAWPYLCDSSKKLECYSPSVCRCAAGYFWGGSTCGNLICSY
jgi:hypothetical protein